MISRYMPLTLTLRAPAVLTSLGGDPNSSRTLPFVPGSALRGAVARALGDPGGDAEQQRKFRTLILDGSVRYLNAYPRAGGRRSLPAPVSLRIEKAGAVSSTDAIAAWDLAAFSGKPDVDEAAWPEQSLSALPEPFVTIGAAQPLRVEPGRGSRIHQQRDRSQGRAWKEERNGREEAHGVIFAFEFLEAGQEFDGLIQIRGESEAHLEERTAVVKKALEGPILLGRSRRGGYGGDAVITWGTPREREVEGQGLVASDLPAGVVFRALLTSPYVGRSSDTGQIDPAHLVAEIGEALSGRVRVFRRRWTFDMVGGFNRKWRLEVPQVLACTAGSVLVLETSGPIPLADLVAVEHAGLGERRVEGFGRLVFLEEPARTVTLRHVPSLPAPIATGTPPDLVRFAEGRILEAVVTKAIAEEAARLARSAKFPPAPSLLGRLRNALRADPTPALETLRTWLADEGSAQLKRPAREQLERCRIGDGGQRLAAWIRGIARHGDGQAFTTHLRLDAIAQRCHVASEDSARSILNERETWIRARLIDGTLAALARQQRSRKPS